MAAEMFNQRAKLAAPPFVTVSVKEKTRWNILGVWAKMGKCEMDDKSSIFSSEVELLRAFVLRKGTQLRLEKALMLTRRIVTLALRWKSNACWDDFCKFKDAFESHDAKLKPEQKVEKRQIKKTDRVKGNMQEIRLPSRQWANWVTYLTLRDLLLLSKIKFECERTVGYWLGMISCAHHAGDSLIIVGILSRIWAVSSGMVEEYANQVYPSLCFISSLLSPTRADNWLEDIDFPNDLFTWLEKILGFPFTPASVGGSEHIFKMEDGVGGRRRTGSTSCTKSRIDKVLGGVFRSSSIKEEKSLVSEEDTPTPTSSSRIHDRGCDEEVEEDLGEPVAIKQKQQPTSGSKKRMKGKSKKKQQRTLAEQAKQKPQLNEKWTKFFKNYKSKLVSETGRKQLLVRVKKAKKAESNSQIRLKLVKLKKFLMQGEQDKIQSFIPKFKRFLSKEKL